MRFFGWFRKRKQEVLPRRTPAPRGSLEHCEFRLEHQIKQRDKWQTIVDAGAGNPNKTHEQCVQTLYEIAAKPFQTFPNKIAYWEAQVAAAKISEQSRVEQPGSSSDS